MNPNSLKVDDELIDTITNTVVLVVGIQFDHSTIYNYMGHPGTVSKIESFSILYDDGTLLEEIPISELKNFSRVTSKTILSDSDDETDWRKCYDKFMNNRS